MMLTLHHVELYPDLVRKKYAEVGETKSFKLALVALKEGQTIDLSGQ